MSPLPCASPKSKSGKSPQSLSMWEIFIDLFFSRRLILTMPSLEKQPWMRPLCFNILQLWAIDSFMGVKFSFPKFFVFCVKLCLLQSILLSFFLLHKTFLFFVHKTHNCFLRITSGLPNLWQALISWLSTKTSSAKTDITDFSKTSSETNSGIPLKTTLFRWPYCAKTLWFDLYFEHRFSSCSHLYLNFSFSSCRFLMTSHWG